MSNLCSFLKFNVSSGTRLFTQCHVMSSSSLLSGADLLHISHIFALERIRNSEVNMRFELTHVFACRYVVGTLDLMVAENYVIVYFCAGGQNDKLPGIGWLRECYTTIDRRYEEPRPFTPLQHVGM